MKSPGRNSPDILLHDVASLSAFVSSVVEDADPERLRGGSYLPSSERFLDYIWRVGQATIDFLAQFAHTTRRDKFYKIRRLKLYELRSYWFELHEYIKATLDAHTLEIPSSLINVLIRRLTTVEGFAGTTFAVFQIDELNYLMLRSSYVLDLLQNVGKKVGYSGPVPADLGLLGIPYSQAPALFPNLLIAHEIGHFVFENSAVIDELHDAVLASLESSLGATYKGLTPTDKSWFADRLESWTEEIFCDLFAIYMVGPSYSFAFIELFDLCAIVDPNDASGYSLFPEVCAFSESHPADLLRVRAQAELLDALGWWKHLDKLKSHYVTVLQAARSAPASCFVVDQELRDQQMLAERLPSAFQKLLPKIVTALKKRMKQFESGEKFFSEENSAVEPCFHQALVPSTVYVWKDKKKKTTKRIRPHPVTIINSCFAVYLASMDILLQNIERPNPQPVADRVKWAKRLQEWALKALEDVELMEQAASS